MTYHRTLGDGLTVFRSTHSDKLCSDCGKETLFPYKMHRHGDEVYLCEIYCSRCGKIADSFTFRKPTLNRTKTSKQIVAQDLEAFTYRLQRKLFTPAMERILKALDAWSENNPSAATCQQIADLAGVHQTYIQRVIRCLEKEGYVKLWKRRDGKLAVPGVFILKGWKSLKGIVHYE